MTLKKNILSSTICILLIGSYLTFPLLIKISYKYSNNIPLSFKGGFDGLQTGIKAFPNFYDFLYSPIISIIYLILRLITFKPLMFIGSKIIVNNPKWSEFEKSNRIRRFANNSFKLGHFTFISYIAWSLFSNSDFFPDVFGGKGKIENIFDEWPYQNVISGQKYYYLFQIGFHFHNIIWLLLFESSKNNFLEMTLHDLCTISLITLSYLYNFQYAGILVLFLHDCSDIPIYITKSIVDSSYTKLIFSSYISMCIIWIYTRLYVFPYHMIYVGLKFDFDGNFNYQLVMISFLIILQVLHIYWFLLFLAMGHKFIFTGAHDDIIDNVQTTKLS